MQARLSGEPQVSQYYPYIYTITRTMLKWCDYNHIQLAQHANLPDEVIQHILCKRPISDRTAQNILMAYYRLGLSTGD